VDVLAPAGGLGVAAFGLGMAAMFTFSALLHLKRWDAGTYERLFRLDHSGIYLAIGGTGVAVALLGLDGWPRLALLLGMGVGSLIGIVVEWLPFAPPRASTSAVYLTIGWLPVALLPWLWIRRQGRGSRSCCSVASSTPSVRGGRALRPDPWPTWFGYHEIFHLFVIAAVVAHAVMLDVLGAEASTPVVQRRG
jgi:hemolysin III